ncbi:MAG: 5-formyltetrahydrofolate cyclo-ligase, partial [Pseudomonadota bacterium]
MSPSLSFATKDAARTHVWDRLSHEKLAAFPFPPHGRIPNFKGTGEAAKRLFDIPVFANAKALKINPDSAQSAVRADALRRGIDVYVPTPKLAGGFWRIEAAAVPHDAVRQAAAMSTMPKWATQVALQDLPQMDAIVSGSVAVTPTGKRCGKGAGYADREYGILLELGHAPAPVATTIHDVQLVDDFPQVGTDEPLTFIVTPTRSLEIASPPDAPHG